MYLSKQNPQSQLKYIARINEYITKGGAELVEAGLNAISSYYNHIDTSIDQTHTKLNEYFVLSIE